MRYDIAIVGSGPAGISAAINAKIRNKNFILFGNKNLSSKIEKAQSIDNYLGFYNITGKELQDRFKQHIESMDIDIDEHKITNIYAMGDYFTLMSGDDMFEATTVILATGINLSKSLKGEEQFLGRGVSYCATCDAPLYRNKEVSVLGYNDESIHEANFLNEIASKTYFIPMRRSLQDGLDYLDDEIEIIDKKPLEIKGKQLVNKIDFKEESLDVDGVFIIRDNMSPKNLVPGLEMEGDHIKTSIDMKTNIDGLFACGDCTGKPYSYIKSAGQGLTAALSAVEYISNKKLKKS